MDRLEPHGWCLCNSAVDPRRHSGDASGAFWPNVPRRPQVLIDVRGLG